MIQIKLKEHYEKVLQILLIILTYVMIILRFLLNEKGRVSPDSIRYLRQAKLFPIIDNTTAPLGYSFSIKLFTFLGADYFWSSKIVGILAYTFVIWFCYQKKFYFREILVTSALFSFVSIYSFTMSESLTLPFVILLFYTAKETLKDKITFQKSVFLLTLYLVILLNIRYNSLFFCFGLVGFGILNFRETYAKSFFVSGFLGIVFYIIYKFTVIDYFNGDYLNDFLEIGLTPTSELLVEFFQGITTTFNPFIHIADPNGGIINYGIYGIGLLSVVMMIYLFVKISLSSIEKFILIVNGICILASYFIQYFYSVNALDYRLMAPFSIGVWMVFLRRIFITFNDLGYSIAFLSLFTGFAFTWLSKGNYLENRKMISDYLKKEKLIDKKLSFYVKDDMDNDGQTAELISTVNPDIDYTFNPKDTLKILTLTRYKVEEKISIKKNKYQ